MTVLHPNPCHNEACYKGTAQYIGYLLFGGNTNIFHPECGDTGPRSAVGNVSDYRCVSNCRSRGREFDPGPVPYFRGD